MTFGIQIRILTVKQTTKYVLPHTSSLLLLPLVTLLMYSLVFEVITKFLAFLHHLKYQSILSYASDVRPWPWPEATDHWPWPFKSWPWPWRSWPSRPRHWPWPEHACQTLCWRHSYNEVQ